jgi:hypothetical protein
LARKAADAIQFFIPTFKNPAFHEENEWRLIFTPSPGGADIALPKVKFRVGRSMLVPYYSLQDIRASPMSPVVMPSLLPIVGVRLGPSPTQAPQREKRAHALRTKWLPGRTD